MKSLVIAVLVAVAIFQGADAQCYNCTLTNLGDITVGQAGCGEPFNSAGIETVPCSDKCVTISTEIAADAAAGTPAISVILRSCYATVGQPGVPCVDLTNFEAAPGTILSQTCCTGALCNGGGSDTPATTPSSAEFLTFSAALAVFAPLCAAIF